MAFSPLEMKGPPPPAFNDMIMKTVVGGKVGIKINGENGPFFNTHQGLRQGDPLSPILFDLASDSLAIMVNRAVKNKLISGLVTHLDADLIAILQYTDDTILLIQDDLVQARNLKFLLCLFEQMSGLKKKLSQKVKFFVWGAHKIQPRILSGFLPAKVVSSRSNSDWTLR